MRKRVSPRRFEPHEGGSRASKRPAVYTSVSKMLHRQRIALDMRSYVAGGRVPSLLYLGNPDGTDSAFFQATVDDGELPRSATFTAVNDGVFHPRVKKMHSVRATENTEILTVATNADTESFSHAWLDLTEREPDPQLMHELNRVLANAAGRDCVYVTLSKRCRSYDDSLVVMTAMCDAWGFKITHVEDYQGGEQTVKRNMMFFVLAGKGLVSAQATGAYINEKSIVGCIAWLRRRGGRKPNTMRHKSGVKYDTHVGFVRAWRASTTNYEVSFFDSDGHLHTAVSESVPPADIKAYMPFLRSKIKHSPP